MIQTVTVSNEYFTGITFLCGFRRLRWSIWRNKSNRLFWSAQHWAWDAFRTMLWFASASNKPRLRDICAKMQRRAGGIHVKSTSDFVSIFWDKFNWRVKVRQRFMINFSHFRKLWFHFNKNIITFSNVLVDWSTSIPKMVLLVFAIIGEILPSGEHGAW